MNRIALLIPLAILEICHVWNTSTALGIISRQPLPPKHISQIRTTLTLDKSFTAMRPFGSSESEDLSQR